MDVYTILIFILDLQADHQESLDKVTYAALPN